MLNLTAVSTGELSFMEHPPWAGPLTDSRSASTPVRQVSFSPFHGDQSEAQRVVTQTVSGGVGIFSPSAPWPLHSHPFHYGLPADVGCHSQDSIWSQVWKPMLHRELLPSNLDERTTV